MSIRKMIALHPGAEGHVNQPLGDAVHHAMYCAKMCLSCADACSAEKMDMTQCGLARLRRLPATRPRCGNPRHIPGT